MKTLLKIPSRKALLLIALLSGGASGVLLGKMAELDRLLKPYDIVRYEFAGTAERAKEMFSAWGSEGMAAARESLRYDFGFLVAYSLCFSSLTLLAARAAPERYAKAGVWLSLAPFAAAALDAIENVALLRVLERAEQPSSPLLQVAAVAAGAKFLLLTASVGYAATVGLSWLMRRRRALAATPR